MAMTRPVTNEVRPTNLSLLLPIKMRMITCELEIAYSEEPNG